MKCPNCGAVMKTMGNTSKGVEYSCTNCGMRRHGLADAPTAEVAARETKKERLAPEVSKTKSKTSVSKIQKRLDKAKRLTELRQIAKDLTSRINDLEIQMDRKVEELQTISVRLQQMIESDPD